MEHVPDPRTAPPLRWGVLAPGGIAQDFVEALVHETTQRVVAVGSRDIGRARAFASRWDVPAAYGSYAELLADEEVEAVYVASPHSHHHAHALAAIEAGKHVLVEKAFTRDAPQALDLVQAAEGAGVFLMEAMWTRFLPHMVALRSLLADGAVGEVVSVTADHGQWFAHDPAHRLFNPDLAGGALLDLGIYPVSFACDVLGLPEAVVATGDLTDTGVDGQASILLDFPGRGSATLHTTLWSRTPTVAAINGTEGRIEIDPIFYAPSSVHVHRRDGGEQHLQWPGVKRGHHFQAAEMARRIADGELFSPIMSPGESAAIMGVLDRIRAHLGVVYPGE